MSNIFGAILSIKYGQEKFELKILRFHLKVFGETIDWQIWVSIDDNEDKKIFVVPLTHTLKEDIEREVQ